MLALTDSALAHLVIAASAIAPHDRGLRLKDIAAKLDSPRARRQAKARSRRRNAVHVYRLEAFRSRGRGQARAASNGRRTPDILRGIDQAPPP
jgi:hypothetical protein